MNHRERVVTTPQRVRVLKIAKERKCVGQEVWLQRSDKREFQIIPFLLIKIFR